MFEIDDNIEVQSKRFIKKLNRVLHKCFKKIQIKSTYNCKIYKLFTKRNNLRRLKNADNKQKKELDRVEAELAKEMYEILKDEVEKVKSN